MSSLCRFSPGPVNEEFPNPARQSQGPALYSRLSVLLSGIVDSFSSALFCMSYSSLAHLIHTIWCRLTVEE